MTPEALRQEAETLRQQGRQREALARLEDLVRPTPDAAGGWFAYGRALSGAGRDGEAVTALQRACELDRSDTAARTALGELDVRDATFANVVSDARRSLARAVVPAEGAEWIGRTLTEQLPLHAHVVTDAELLRRRLDHSRGLPPRHAIELLRPGVALVRDLPFAGTDYLWPHAEGITSALAVLAVSAYDYLGEAVESLGDVDGVFWSTGQGLLALPGHEELIGLRMRAHAQLGDLAGVRQEWEAYERAVTGGSWCDGEASPKLLALRRELLQR